MSVVKNDYATKMVSIDDDVVFETKETSGGDYDGFRRSKVFRITISRC